MEDTGEQQQQHSGPDKQDSCQSQDSLIAGGDRGPPSAHVPADVPHGCIPGCSVASCSTSNEDTPTTDDSPPTTSLKYSNSPGHGEHIENDDNVTDPNAVTSDSNNLSDAGLSASTQLPASGSTSLQSTIRPSSNTNQEHSIPSLSPTPMQSLAPQHLLSLLYCPDASPSHYLSAPTTLHCGHTLCSHHVRTPLPRFPSPPSSLRRRTHNSPSPPPPVTPPQILPSCPLPACAPSSRSSTSSSSSSSHLPNLPSTSRVAYFPAPPPPPATPTPTTRIPDPKVDVTVNKVLSLVSRAQAWLEEEEARKTGFVPRIDNGDDTDTEDDDDDADQPEAQQDQEEWDLEYIDDPQPQTSPLPIASSSSTALHSPPSPTRPPTLRPRPHDLDPSSSPSHRPHKRRRRHLHPPSPPPAVDDDDDEPDLLAHLRRQTVRQRTVRHDQPLLGPNFGASGNPGPGALARFEKELLSELTCEICFMLLYQPVTTPCQHTFCAKCLHRSLDHSPSCPLCRQDLPGFSYFQEHPYNQVLLTIILKAFPAIYQERGEAIEAEERDARLDTPIFVCQLSFPGMPTLLHFFEPRYRLMLRRCLESPHPCFGMIMPPRPGAPSADYGTMLEIRSVQMLSDGRSMVETWGTHRFRILEKGTLDGYMVGRIERIDDYPDELEEGAVADEEQERRPDEGTSGRQILSRIGSSLSPSSSTSSSTHRFSPRTNEQLMSTCKAFLAQLRQGTAPWVVQRLNNTYGPMPTDASSFSFWVALVLPIDEHEKAKLLPIRSARLRLRLVVHWIEQLNNNWWFSSGCVIL